MNRKATATLLATGIIFAAVGVNANAAGSHGVPMCVKFAGATSLIKNDSHATQQYRDSESDVLAASTGGLGFTTDYRKGPRKVWVDLKSAVQVPGTSVDISKLPRGAFEFIFDSLRHNNADGTASALNGGCLPFVTEVLAMSAGEFLLTAPRIMFTDTSATASKGDYRLLFGQPMCGSFSSDCPLKLSAGYDFDSDGVIDSSEANLDASADGSADIWTIEPLRPDARVHLLKVNKQQQWASFGFFELPFKLVFAKEPFSAVLNQIN